MALRQKNTVTKHNIICMISYDEHVVGPLAYCSISGLKDLELKTS